MHMDIVVDVTHYFVVNDYDHGYNRTQLVAILRKVRVAARNQSGFFTYKSVLRNSGRLKPGTKCHR